MVGELGRKRCLTRGVQTDARVDAKHSSLFLRPNLGLHLPLVAARGPSRPSEEKIKPRGISNYSPPFLIPAEGPPSMTPFCLNVLRANNASGYDALSMTRRLGRSCYLAKTEIISAFRTMPVHIYDYHLLDFHWKSRWLFLA